MECNAHTQCPEKDATILLSITLINANYFQNSFTDRFSSKLVKAAFIASDFFVSYGSISTSLY